MKKILYALTILVMFQCGSSSLNLFKKKPMPVVDEMFQPYFNKLDSIYKANDIKIDYSKVSRITHIDSIPYMDGKSYEGLYNFKTKVVYINPNQLEAFFRGHYRDMLILILAHEIAHSQGKAHSSQEGSIMYHNSTYSLSLLDACSVEELVTDVYLKDYEVYIEPIVIRLH